ncbi:FG-GAP repeat domain-containing protein [Sandaracinus amylolyticus]|uniref:FG-GAP repeat domain-containing protein n=1 Tax=Sandaracinus amylolyticus TaxID=927083 RepID=UPI001F24936D|nr:VCBS repeat-containing protein [Sandaracinus amylolyticus]
MRHPLALATSAWLATATIVSGCLVSFDLPSDAGSVDAGLDATREDAAPLPFEPYPPFDAGPPRGRNALGFSRVAFGIQDAHTARGGTQIFDVDLNDHDGDGDLDVLVLDRGGLPPQADAAAPPSVVLRSAIVEANDMRFDDVTTSVFDIAGAEWDLSGQDWLFFAPLAPSMLFAPQYFVAGWAYEVASPLRFTVAERFPGGDNDLAGEGFTTGDVNGDGRPDVLVTSWGRPTQLFLRTASGGWEERSEFPHDLVSTRSAWLADFDDDGVLDLLTMPYAETLVARDWPATLPPIEAHLMRGLPSGEFESTRATAALEDDALNVGIAAVGDFDGDGRLDIFQAGRRVAPETARPVSPDTPMEIRVLFNEGGMQLTPVTIPLALPARIVDHAIAADLDNDGDLDVAMLANELRVYLSDGARGFTFAQFTGVFHEEGIAAGDVDLDGDVDVLEHGFEEVDVLRNGTNGTDFLEVWLRAGDQNPEAIGASIRVVPAGRGGDPSAPIIARRDVLSSSAQPVAYALHVGLPEGAESTFDLEVRWPGATTPHVVHDVPRGARLRVRRP